METGLVPACLVDNGSHIYTDALLAIVHMRKTTVMVILFAAGQMASVVLYRKIQTKL